MKKNPANHSTAFMNVKDIWKEIKKITIEGKRLRKFVYIAVSIYYVNLYCIPVYIYSVM